MEHPKLDSCPSIAFLSLVKFISFAKKKLLFIGPTLTTIKLENGSNLICVGSQLDSVPRSKPFLEICLSYFFLE